MITSKILILFLILHLIKLSSCVQTFCIETEKQALLSFKEGLNDPLNHLSSWSPNLQEDCCLWSFVICNDTTSHVSELHLGNTNLSGNLTNSLLNLSSILHLDLSGNDFKGIPFPTFIGSLNSLQHLNLSNSGLAGPLPISIASLSNLETLILDNTALSGIISEAHFTNCSKLKSLNATSTDLIFNFSSDWIPPFQLDSAFLSYTQVGPTFPSWLRTQASLNYLFLAYSSIQDSVPNWFWSWVSRIHHVDLTGNQITGDLSNITINSTMIRLSSNLFTGQLPFVSSNVRWLTLRNNSLTGNLSTFLCNKHHIGNNMQQLSIQMNKLSGGLSDCWENWQSLILLNLALNQFSGTIPTSMSSLQALQGLHLHRNNLKGEITTSLQNLTSLRYLNLEHNELSGEIPGWIGERYTNLAVLSLSSNKLRGEIPSQLCNLPSLLVLGLANNSISGIIPECLNNLTLMKTPNTPNNFTLDIVIRDPKGDLVDTFTEYLDIYSKGSIRLYDKTLRLIRVIDLSSNRISGAIPSVVCELIGLRFLNLSNNRLTGVIPERIGEIESLESLDISDNSLVGEIPESMSKLNALASLNVSYNGLWGRIPTSTQLQSFEESCYQGNGGLCGPPIGVSCGDVEDAGPPASYEDKNEEKQFDVTSFMGGIGSGFAFGFLVACVFYFIRTMNRVNVDDHHHGVSSTSHYLYSNGVIDWFES